jgi:hypothetical protein
MIRRNAIILCFTLGATSLSRSAWAADDANLADEIRLLREQNAALQAQVQKQGSVLDSLTRKVQDLESSQPTNNLNGAAVAEKEPAKSGFSLGKVNLSAEGGVVFFDTGNQGFASHPEFSVDEARLFVDAPIWKEVYFHSDIDLATRENNNTDVQLGELFLDFEDASQLWGRDNQLNVRVGRMFTPFGEEYQTRYAMENPLISHSLPDLWAISPGVELYGSFGQFNYATAVQNSSGKNGVQDFEGDKSVSARVGYDPDAHWHFSLSAMRTGNIDATPGAISAMWFGNGFFQSLGSPATSHFQVNLVESDVTARWNSGHVSAFGGVAHYSDNDPAANNDRNAFYYSVEAVQNLPKKFYVATRFSEVLADQGIPVMGFGNGSYFSSLTSQIWRLSLGVGYRFSDHLELKAEYAFEHGSQTDGSARDHENFFGTEAAFQF